MAETMQHTPGPWVLTTGVLEEKAGSVFVRQGPGVYGSFIAHVHPRNGESTETEVVYDAEAMANARVIAACPEMVALIAELADFVNADHVCLLALRAKNLLRALHGEQPREGEVPK